MRQPDVQLAQMEVLTDWRDRLSREMYALCADPQPIVDGYKCADPERAEIVRENLMEDAASVKEFVEDRMFQIIITGRSLRPSDGFAARVLALLR